MARYLSDEWKREQWEDFEASIIAGDESDCGGWMWDPPCGGCARCMTNQFAYYLMKEEERARVFLRAGFDVAPMDMVTVPWMPGFSAGHDSYNCMMSDERPDLFFPWERHNG